MANRVLLPRAQDSNGDIVPGAVAYFFVEGTTTPLTVYSDESLSTAAGVSLVADATGTFAARYIPAGCKLDIRHPSTNVSLPGYPSDNWHITTTDETGASAILFTPITGNDAENVQDAIANNTAQWNDVTAYGKSLIAADDAGEARETLAVGSNFNSTSTDETADANNATSSGLYALIDGASNAPTGSGNWHLYVAAKAAGPVSQIAVQQNGNSIYSRTRVSGAWNAWVRFIDEREALGIGQTWQQPSRTAGTTYTNSTGKPIQWIVEGSSGGTVQVSSDGVTWITLGTLDGTANTVVSAIVPNTWRYRANTGFVTWSELR